MNFRAISGNKEIARSTVDFEFLPPGANLASDSRVRVTCSDPNAEGRSRLLVDGRTTGTGPWAEWVWATDRSETSHWVRLTFPEPQVVMRVTLHWPVLLRTVCFPKSGTLRGLTPSGRVVPLAAWQGVAEEIQTSLTFQPVSLESIEWVQAAEDGAENQPDRLQLTEIEVH